MTLQETFNELLYSDEDTRKKLIKNMMDNDRQDIVFMMGLPKNCSQKKLCAEIEETARFIRIADGDKTLFG
jgi:hypothetical protein